MIHPNTDSERDLIVGQLTVKSSPALNIRLEQPYKLVNRAWRGYLQTDGILKVCKLES
jgi:hypothetical protein